MTELTALVSRVIEAAAQDHAVKAAAQESAPRTRPRTTRVRPPH